MNKIDRIHILIADDDDEDIELFNEALAELKMDSKLTSFKNGEVLMNYLENIENKLPHILFLDLNMPCKTGHECLKEIRANSRFIDVSIAIYSTSSSEKDIEETFVQGANIYIKKPNDFSKLKKIIKDVVNMDWQYQSSGLNKETFFYSL
ncbi:response regulator [Flavobacterium sandaracinum]|uniref:Response regulator n=1 Tax=Flavobacterium sandaracinum TaxID=2541733 RepID=A0A4R5D2E6_9FLAO|nr:response regulator [Flavobacterium sandaracinum]